jgi:hypothetical protein
LFVLFRWEKRNHNGWLTGVSSLFVLGEMTEPEWANVHYANQTFKRFPIIQHQKR